MERIKINEISLTDLIGLEKIANILCKNYENSIKMYDGTINTNVREYRIYTEYNNIRLQILNEMENRLKNIEYDV
jgi:hypothetical protein